MLSINLRNWIAKNNIERKPIAASHKEPSPRLSTNVFYSHFTQLIFWVQWERNRTAPVLHGCVRVGFLHQVCCCTVFFVRLSNNSTSFWRVGAGAKNDKSSTRVGVPRGRRCRLSGRSLGWLGAWAQAAVSRARPQGSSCFTTRPGPSHTKTKCVYNFQDFKSSKWRNLTCLRTSSEKKFNDVGPYSETKICEKNSSAVGFVKWTRSGWRWSR